MTNCQKKERDELLRIAQTENLYSLDPDTAADAQSRAILSNLYEGLVEFDGDLKIRPALAISWNVPDELTWIFELRRDVKFHDGQRFTAADVKSSFERVGGPGIQDAVAGISSIDVMDDYHVRLRLVHPAALLLNRLTQLMIVPASQAGFTITRPIGTGPYRFVRQKENEMELEVFPEYWRAKPAIRRVSFSALPARLVFDRFAERKLDVYRLLPASVFAQVRSGMRVLGRSGLAVMYLWFNCASLIQNQKNPFADRRVRQAISLTLDRNRIVQKMGGRDTPAHQLIPEGVFGYMPAWGKLAYDPEYARRLIREAGYKEGFETSLAHPPAESYHQLAAAVREMLAPIGIRVLPKELGVMQFLEARRDQRLPFFAFTWTFDDGDAWTFLTASVHSKMGPKDFRSTNPGYSNSVVDRLIEESQNAASIHDLPARYESILKIAISELPIVPLYRRYDLYGVSERVRFDPRLDGKLLAAEMQLLQHDR